VHRHDPAQFSGYRLPYQTILRLRSSPHCTGGRSRLFGTCDCIPSERSYPRVQCSGRGLRSPQPWPLRTLFGWPSHPYIRHTECGKRREVLGHHGCELPVRCGHFQARFRTSQPAGISTSFEKSLRPHLTACNEFKPAPGKEPIRALLQE